jgi:hypothetical protein
VVKDTDDSEMLHIHNFNLWGILKENVQKTEQEIRLGQFGPFTSQTLRGFELIPPCGGVRHF